MDDNYFDAQLFVVRISDEYSEDIIHFLSTVMYPEGSENAQKKRLVAKDTYFQMICGELYKLGPHEILWHYVLEHEQEYILTESHDRLVGGHYSGRETTNNIL